MVKGWCSEDRWGVKVVKGRGSELNVGEVRG